jgi:hypothetical protein
MKTLSFASVIGLSLLGLAGCKNCGVYQSRSVGGLTIGEVWRKSPRQVQSYLCKTPGWQGSANAVGATSVGAECQQAREFQADFIRWGQTYVAVIKDGVVVRVGRRSFCIDT